MYVAIYVYSLQLTHWGSLRSCQFTGELYAHNSRIASEASVESSTFIWNFCEKQLFKLIYTFMESLETKTRNHDPGGDNIDI